MRTRRGGQCVRGVPRCDLVPGATASTWTCVQSGTTSSLHMGLRLTSSKWNSRAMPTLATSPRQEAAYVAPVRGRRAGAGRVAPPSPTLTWNCARPPVTCQRSSVHQPVPGGASRKSSVGVRPPELVTSPHRPPLPFIDVSPTHSIVSAGDPNDPVSMLVSDVVAQASARGGVSTPGGAATPMSWSGHSPAGRARGMVVGGAASVRTRSRGSVASATHGYGPGTRPAGGRQLPGMASQSARLPRSYPAAPNSARGPPPHVTPEQHAAYMRQYHAWMQQQATWHAYQWAATSTRPPATGAASSSPARSRRKKRGLQRRRQRRLSNSGKRGSLIQYGESSEPGTPGGQVSTPRSETLAASDPHMRVPPAAAAGGPVPDASPPVPPVPPPERSGSAEQGTALRTDSAQLQGVGGPSIRVPACPTRHDDLISDFLTTVGEPAVHK